MSSGFQSLLAKQIEEKRQLEKRSKTKQSPNVQNNLVRPTPSLPQNNKKNGKQNSSTYV